MTILHHCLVCCTASVNRRSTMLAKWQLEVGSLILCCRLLYWESHTFKYWGIGQEILSHMLPSPVAVCYQRDSPDWTAQLHRGEGLTCNEEAHTLSSCHEKGAHSKKQISHKKGLLPPDKVSQSPAQRRPRGSAEHCCADDHALDPVQAATDASPADLRCSRASELSVPEDTTRRCMNGEVLGLTHAGKGHTEGDLLQPSSSMVLSNMRRPGMPQTNCFT